MLLKERQREKRAQCCIELQPRLTTLSKHRLMLSVMNLVPLKERKRHRLRQRSYMVETLVFTRLLLNPSLVLNRG